MKPLMNKIMIGLAVAMTALTNAYAQTPMDTADRLEQSWGKGKYLNVGYALSQSGTDFSAVEKSSLAFFISRGRSYLFPAEPVANVVKFGFDVNWVDLSFAKYASVDPLPGHGGESPIPDLGRMSLQLGLIGVGPNVSVVPFGTSDSAARYLKASVYFHYQPTVGAYMLADGGEYDLSWAYCNMFRLGGRLKWKFIGIGMEGYWGSGNFRSIDLMSMLPEDAGLDDFSEILGAPASGAAGKMKRRFASTRFYISFRF